MWRDRKPHASRDRLSIPQAFVIQRPAGFVDPSLWEDGIPVAMLSWDLNGWHADMPDSSTDSDICLRE